MASLKKLIEKLKTEESNKKIGRTGPIESRPTADLAYRYNRLKESGENPDSEEEAIKKLIEQEGSELKSQIQIPPDFADRNKETRNERIELLKELQKRKKEKKD